MFKQQKNKMKKKFIGHAKLIYLRPTHIYTLTLLHLAEQTKTSRNKNKSLDNKTNNI